MRGLRRSHTARAPRGRRHRRRLRASPRPAAPARRPSSSLAVSSALVSLGRGAARSADALNSVRAPSKRNGPGEVRPACAMRNHVFAGHSVGGFLHCGQDPRVHPALFANPFTNFWRAPTLPERRTAARPGGWSINRTARSCERRMLNPPVRGRKICGANVAHQVRNQGQSTRGADSNTAGQKAFCPFRSRTRGRF